MTSFGHIRKAGSLLGLVFFTALFLLGQGTQQLYVVTGLAPTNSDPWGVVASLLAIDELHSAAVKITDLGGASSILVSRSRIL